MEQDEVRLETLRPTGTRKEHELPRTAKRADSRVLTWVGGVDGGSADGILAAWFKEVCI